MTGTFRRIKLSLAMLLGFAVATTAFADEATKARDLLGEAHAAADRGESEAAVKAATKAIELDASLASAYYLRGRERFKLAQFQGSVADFDRYVELTPQAASRQWERGIALYYAGEYARGAEQFALYQTYHNADVENAAWRYLCVARIEEAKGGGIEKARASLLPIENDRRVPMMEIYRLYKGDATPDDVLKAVRAGDPDEAELAGRLFYARLYVGLHYEAAGQHDLARKYLLEAADAHSETRTINRYMYDVARVHAQKLRAAK
jgi:lipoprotein NlpI